MTSSRLLLLVTASLFAQLGACSKPSPATSTADGGGVATSAVVPSGSAAAADAPAPTSTLPDPCTLVPLAEAQAIVARKLVKANSVMTGDDRRCQLQDAETYTVLHVHMHANPSTHRPNGPMQSPKIAGVGDDAYLGSMQTIYVKAKGVSFFAQALFPVKDGVISPEVKAAVATLKKKPTKGDDEEKLVEASYRLAKLVVSKM